MKRRVALGSGLAAMLLAGCSGNWGVKYDDAPDPAVARKWRLSRIAASVPDSLTVSEDNSYAPNADIVWHGEDFGDRRKQVAAIMHEGLRKGARGLRGTIPVVLAARVVQFHAVTPAAVARAPGAVHNIKYDLQVFDAATGAPLTQAHRISADLEAYVGSAAVVAAINGDTQRVRIVRHLAAVTAGWLSIGEDQRHTFNGIGR